MFECYDSLSLQNLKTSYLSQFFLNMAHWRLYINRLLEDEIFFSTVKVKLQHIRFSFVINILQNRIIIYETLWWFDDDRTVIITTGGDSVETFILGHFIFSDSTYPMSKWTRGTEKERVQQNKILNWCKLNLLKCERGILWTSLLPHDKGDRPFVINSSGISQPSSGGVGHRFINFP